MMVNIWLKVMPSRTTVSILFYCRTTLDRCSDELFVTVANQQLRGADVVQQAQVIQWLDFADGAILPASSRLVFPLLGIMPFNKQVIMRNTSCFWSSSTFSCLI